MKMDDTPAFVIDTADWEGINQAVTHAPNYETKVACAIKRTIRVMHGIAHLHRNTMLEEVEVYIGRAGYTNVLNRWRDSRSKRGHFYAAVLFSCETGRAIELEGLANRLLCGLKERRTLCVGNANVNPHGGGRVADCDLSVVYMTWDVKRNPEYGEKPDINVIREVSKEASVSCSGGFSYSQIEHGLRLTKRLSEWDRLVWSM
ncbi:hypothetical protein HJC10_15575 [Corallococcus exiguus]|nr:hypothetical protein [Corallococcus exiguus]